MTADFLKLWLDCAGGAERANCQSFLIGLCEVLGVAAPRPADGASADNDYVFERSVRGLTGPGYIDLYKRDCFILEAKQSLKRVRGCSDDGEGRAGGSRRWDRLMRQACEQARRYAFDLPPDHRPPPFLIVCDIGYVFEIYADFSGTGRGYTYFPDRKTYRVRLEELHDADVRDRLKAIWTDPHSLDPSRRKLHATRRIAEELAEVAVWLEAQGKPAQDVALFLMRMIFTMFACSVGLLPQNGLADLIGDCLDRPERFRLLVRDLWVRMNDPEPDARYFAFFNAHVPHFGGALFNGQIAYALPRPLMQVLLRAAQHSWADVEPAIFGSLLEDALAPAERRALGAHFTPRPHVERIVEATIMEPLREDWRLTLVQIERARDDGGQARAHALARDFHDRLRQLRVLDPACGTGNFLYIALELIKRMEAEVLEVLAQLRDQQQLELDTVDPRQFFGLEVNPRAAVIAELVLWIGYLQLHYRTHSGHPAQPILKAFGAIEHRDAILTWDGYPHVRAIRPVDGEPVYRNPRPAPWPSADFIVGNPPFMGGKDLRTRLGDAYAEALWTAHPQMNRSADLVMYWWDQAAEVLARPGTRLRRFGFVTTNSITQSHQRRVVERRLTAETPIHLAFAVPDHPWTRVGGDAAAVRVAMTVCASGAGDGVLMTLDGDGANDGPLSLRAARGRINADLTVGVDLTRAEPLRANAGLCSPGVKLHGAGFIVSLEQAHALGLGRRPGLEDHIRPYRNGRDVVQQTRDAWVIDLYPLGAEAVRRRFPEVYQHLLATVKPHRDANRMAFRREHWWWFGATHELYRSFTAALPRYIVTPETAKHRIFVFLPAGVRADNMLVTVGLSDGFDLGVLSSRTHRLWARATGAVLEDRPRYTKSACFDPFPFPAASLQLRAEISAAAEELDALRRTIQQEHPGLTLTGLYNALEDLRAGRAVVGARLASGRILILDELHRAIDSRVSEAYGWPETLGEGKVLARLLDLNARRRREEQAGVVAWLRPDFQAARVSGRGSSERSAEASPSSAGSGEPWPAAPLPRDRSEQSVAVLQMLEATGAAISSADLARRFTGGGRNAVRVEQALDVLFRYGRISRLADGRVVARRAA